MFARVTVYENVDIELVDRLQELIESLDADPFAELPGYRGSMTLIDRDNARLVGIGYYATGGQAREADTLLTSEPERFIPELPEDVRAALKMRPESVGLYEIVQRD